MIPHVNDGKEKVAENSNEYVNEYRGKDVLWYHQLLLNRPLKVALLAILLSVLTPLLLYNYLFVTNLDATPPDGFSTGSCLIPRSMRLPCGTGSVIDTECHSQCCYDYELSLCFHRFPSRFTYIVEEQGTENITLLPRIETVPYKLQASSQIQLSIDEISPTHVSITFYDPTQMTVESRRIPEKNYTYHVSAPELNVIINDTQGHDMFNTVRGPIIASENIWEIAFKTTEEAMYGLGHIPLDEGTVKVLYNHDGDSNEIPLIFSRTNNTYHGLLIDITEPTEVRVEGDNQIVVRSITNRGLKFHLFIGPEPKDIMDKVINVIGFKNDLEYWMLGAHICSEISTPTNAYEDLVEFTRAAANEKLPYDSHCGVAPVVFHDDCKENYERRELIKSMELIREYKKRFVPHISPYIYYKESNSTEDNNSTEVDIDPRSPRVHNINCTNVLPRFKTFMLRTPVSEDLYNGSVDNKSVIYPDYEMTPKELIASLWDGPEIDGLVLENTWPVDESYKLHNETESILPYFNEHFEKAFNHTPQWNLTRPNNETYMYTHNQYGNHFTKAFRLTLLKHIPIFTTAQWMEGEMVNRQNVDASWANLQRELNIAALSGVSGNWLFTSPICGDTKNFNNETQIELCVKWYMAAAFLPLIKIHSKDIPRHPLSFSGTNKANILNGLKNRYSLLPYFYTTLQKGPLLRPMFYQFPFSSTITDLKTQFSVGDDLLIVPNLQPSQSHVHVQMPPGHWFELWSGLPLEAEEGETVTMTTTAADFLVLIRAGAIVVMQKDVRETAEETRLNSDYSLTIALECKQLNVTELSKTKNVTVCLAEGELYINEEQIITFEANSEQLIIKAKGQDLSPLCAQEAEWSRTIKDLYVFGLDKQHNNYDNYKRVEVLENVCRLETEEEIVINLV